MLGGIDVTRGDMATSQTRGPDKRHERGHKRIDPDNPNDRTFKLVTMFVLLLCCHNSFFFREHQPIPPPDIIHLLKIPPLPHPI